MIQNYIVDKLTLSDLKENGKVRIPNFQRGIVWTLQHRKEFISTVKSGDPFGVVLVSQESPQDPYYLIDGLQRLSTLKSYMDNPLEYIDENDEFIDESKLQLLFEEKYKSLGLQMPKEDRLKKEKKSFLKKFIAHLKSLKNIPSNGIEIFEKIAEILGVSVDKFQVISAFSSFYSSFLKNMELPDIIIHAIVYQGPKDRLPSVFETLNTSSVSLTKYEVFSSKWPNTKILVNDDEIISKVWSKYENLKKSSSFDVDITREAIKQEGMTLFEYCFGFSELICDDKKSYSFLFNKGKKSTDPTGFEILALACGLGVNRADDIWKNEYLGQATGAFLVELKDALINAINIVSSSIKNWVFDLKKTHIKNSSTYQIYYMIASVFKHLYVLDLKSKEINKIENSSWVDDFKKNAFKWYFYHQITSFWNEHRQVSDLKELIQNESNDYLYSSNISRETWEKALNDYFKTMKESATSRTISNETKLFLNYLYKLMMEKDRNVQKYFEVEKEDEKKIIFDIEHIVPVHKFSKFDEELPISALGNLCYLAVKDNRAKGEYTIYEYALDRPALTFEEGFKNIIDYPNREDLSFIDCPYDQFVEPYNNLIENRERRLICKYVELILELK